MQRRAVKRPFYSFLLCFICVSAIFGMFHGIQKSIKMTNGYIPLNQITKVWFVILTSSRTRGSCLVSLGAFTIDLCLVSILASTLATGLATGLTTGWGSGLGTDLGSGFGAAFGAGLGSLLGEGLCSILLVNFLSSLTSVLDSGLLSVIQAGRSFTGSLVSALCLTSAAFGFGVTALGDSLGAGRGGGSSSSVVRTRLVLTGTAAGAGSATLDSESIFCRALISRSDPCSALALWRLGVRDGTLLLGAERSSSAASEAGAMAGVEDGVVGRLLGLLPARLLPLLLLPRLALSPFQLPGLKRFGSSLLGTLGTMTAVGEGVRAEVELCLRLSISCKKGLSGGVGRESSADKGSCIPVSAFSLLSATSCKARFFIYSGPERHHVMHALLEIALGSVDDIDNIWL